MEPTPRFGTIKAAGLSRSNTMKQPTNPHTTRQTLRLYWKLRFQHKKLFFLSLTYFLGVTGISVLVPLLISMTLAGIVTGTGGIGENLGLLIAAAALGVVGNLVGFIAIVRLAARGNMDALELALETLLARSVGFHTNNIGGKLVSNALDFANGYMKLADVIVIQIIPFALTMIVGIGVVLSRSLPIGLALLGVTIVTLALIIIESKRRSGLRAERKRAQEKMIANFSDTVVNTQAIKTFAQEEHELSTHRRLDGNLMHFRLKDWTGTAVLGTTRMAILLALQIGFIAFMASLLQQDPSILGIGIFAFAYTLSLTSKLFEVGTMIRGIEEALLMSATMTEIIMDQKEIVDTSNAKALAIKKGEITLKNMSFAYSDATHKHVFKNLSLTIPAGQKVGVVGPSGGGKSTLTRLLLRFDDVTAGSIMIDGQDISSVTQTSLRRAISYVPQEPLLFHRGIKENIAYGKPGASDEEIKHAAHLAFADTFIQELPEAYDTIVGERGVKLSGGQRQRIAIARAILKNAPILILDEATSALDSESEVYIQKALAELIKGRTTIVIAHRLSTIKKMDRIIVIDNGNIVEDGTHKKLSGANGMYASLWSHQSGGFMEE
jgi:ATP-binding cassette, subfamily B, bacterial